MKRHEVASERLGRTSRPTELDREEKPEERTAVSHWRRHDNQINNRSSTALLLGQCLTVTRKKI